MDANEQESGLLSVLSLWVFIRCPAPWAQRTDSLWAAGGRSDTGCGCFLVDHMDPAQTARGRCHLQKAGRCWQLALKSKTIQKITFQYFSVEVWVFCGSGRSGAVAHGAVPGGTTYHSCIRYLISLLLSFHSCLLGWGHSQLQSCCQWVLLFTCKEKIKSLIVPTVCACAFLKGLTWKHLS